jgi:hypothetical protein
MRMAGLLPILLLLVFANALFPLSSESDETCLASAQAGYRSCIRRTIRALREFQVSRLDSRADVTDADVRRRNRETSPPSIDGGRVRKIPAPASDFDSPSEAD